MVPKTYIINNLQINIIKKKRDFPGGPVVKSLPCHAGDTGLIPGWGTKIPHASTKTRGSQINKYVKKKKKKNDRIGKWVRNIKR